MTRPIQLIALTWFMLLSVSCSKPAAKDDAVYMAAGRQPQIAMDSKGTIRVVYGQEDSIYCATSTDAGETFSKPALVGRVEGLYLGMSMGPQIASSANYPMVTAIDKKGNIHSFRLSPDRKKWAKAAGVNDIPGSVPEGLMSISADEKGTFYAVWLDVRDGKQNKIVFASASGDASTWSSNKVIYESPDKTVCECCKPSIDVAGNQVVLMFRNWLNGARDFYITRSTDGGKSFDQPQKLGTGTWKLEGCPMDGGGVLLDSQHMIHTAWQRDGSIYYAQPSKPEIQIGQGRNCRISGAKEPVIAWKDGADLKAKYLSSGIEKTVGTGSYIETVAVADEKILCVWEDKGKIHFRKIQL